MVKNVIYHRAGIDLRTINGFNLWKSDLYKVGKSIGLQDSDIIQGTIHVTGDLQQQAGSYNLIDIRVEGNDQPSYSRTADNGWGELIIYLAENVSNYADYVILSGRGNNITGQHSYIDFSLFKLDSTHKFLISYIATSNNSDYSNPSQILVRHDIIANNYHKFYCGDSDSASSYRSRWNVAITDNGGIISPLGASPSSSSNLSTMTFITSATQLPFQATNSDISILRSSSLSIFFTKIQDISQSNNNSLAIYFVNKKEPDMEDSSIERNSLASATNLSVFCLSPVFEDIVETIPNSYFANIYGLNRGTVPVLVNMTSKIADYYAPYLYLKETPNEHLFGTVSLGNANNKFIAGSYLCLKCGAEGEVT